MQRRAPEVAVAEAINRVLEAESEAAEVIAAAEKNAEAVLEAARERRRQILETARRRASRLHARAQEQLRKGIEQLDRAEPAQETDLKKLRAISSAAVARLATRLTSDDDEPD
jgi:vacuolar-type H+-ATPase subunit H